MLVTLAMILSALLVPSSVVNAKGQVEVGMQSLDLKTNTISESVGAVTRDSAQPSFKDYPACSVFAPYADRKSIPVKVINNTTAVWVNTNNANASLTATLLRSSNDTDKAGHLDEAIRNFIWGCSPATFRDGAERVFFNGSCFGAANHSDYSCSVLLEGYSYPPKSSSDAVVGVASIGRTMAAVAAYAGVLGAVMML
ncbi:hypothetical protein BC831DRAFT_434377 [Entophlyctis helioformis]|nr:hypothetical protein BC831DRAFT_434377 [Entophlyctis helioformis]